MEKKNAYPTPENLAVNIKIIKRNGKQNGSLP